MTPISLPTTTSSSPKKSGLRLRNRHILDQKDDEYIWRAFASFIFLTVDQTVRFLGRSPDYVQKRLKAFWDSALLDRAQDSLTTPCLYFLSRKGGEKVAELGYIPHARWAQKKGLIAHDWTVSEFHLLLFLALRAIGKTLVWEQWRGDMADLVDPTGAVDLIPDGRFAVEGDDEFSLLEVVRANQRSGKKRPGGVKSKDLVDKLREYMNLDIRRVLITFPTKERADNFLKKISPEFQTTHIWITDEPSFKADILGSIWRTPANFEKRTYSILPPEHLGLIETAE